MPDPIINRNAVNQIPVAKPTLTEWEADAARDAVRSGWVSGGPRVREFEAAIASAHCKTHGVSTNSGTTALQIALAALNIGPGDEVIVPALTMVACGNAILYQGATPVFIDSEPETGNADPKWLSALVTKKTKAIIAVHLYGAPCEQFIDECQSTYSHIPVIEDCAEAHFAHFSDGLPVGSRGDLACWSFFGNKIIACGEAGLVATDDESTADRMRSLTSHAFTPGNHFHHQELAYGYRIGEVTAAIGLAQFHRREAILKRRAKLFDRYWERLSIARSITIQHRPYGSADWVFPILADDESQRDAIRADLAAAGVETRSWFVPLSSQPHLRQFSSRRSNYPAVANYLSRRGLYLPLYFDLTIPDVDFICDTVCDTIRSF